MCAIVVSAIAADNYWRKYMQHFSYTPQGVCSQNISFDIEEGEMIINNWLQKHSIDFRSQYSFDNCVLSSSRRPFFDFVLFKNDKPYLVIEYNGRQHYEATGGWNTEEEFEKTQRRDREKLQWCEDNHYPVLVIKYDEDIERILEERLL